jgi:hypothetical protein
MESSSLEFCTTHLLTYTCNSSYKSKAGAQEHELAKGQVVDITGLPIRECINSIFVCLAHSWGLHP